MQRVSAEPPCGRCRQTPQAGGHVTRESQTLATHDTPCRSPPGSSPQTGPWRLGQGTGAQGAASAHGAASLTKWARSASWAAVDRVRMVKRQACCRPAASGTVREVYGSPLSRVPLLHGRRAGAKRARKRSYSMSGTSADGNPAERGEAASSGHVLLKLNAAPSMSTYPLLVIHNQTSSRSAARPSSAPNRPRFIT